MRKTSIASNIGMDSSGKRVSHKELILAGMLSDSVILEKGGTYEAIAQASGLTYGQTWKRLSELEKANKIYDTGRVFPLISGDSGTVWALVGGMDIVTLASVEDNARKGQEKHTAPKANTANRPVLSREEMKNIDSGAYSKVTAALQRRIIIDNQQDKHTAQAEFPFPDLSGSKWVDYIL